MAILDLPPFAFYLWMDRIEGRPQFYHSKIPQNSIGSFASPSWNSDTECILYPHPSFESI